MPPYISGKSKGFLVFACVVMFEALLFGLLQFYYHYSLPSMALLAALALACDALWRNGWRKSALAPVIGSVLMFAWFYPIISAAPLAGPDSFKVWTWLASWR